MTINFNFWHTTENIEHTTLGMCAQDSLSLGRYSQTFNYLLC